MKKVFRPLPVLGLLIGLLPLYNIYWTLVTQNVILGWWPVTEILAWPSMAGLEMWRGEMAIPTYQGHAPLSFLINRWTLWTVVNLVCWLTPAMWLDHLFAKRRGEALEPLWKLPPLPTPAPRWPFPRLTFRLWSFWSKLDLRSRILLFAAICGLVPFLNFYLELATNDFPYFYWRTTKLFGWPAETLTRHLDPRMLPNFDEQQSFRVFFTTWPLFSALNLYLWICGGLLCAWAVELVKKRQA